MTKDDIIRMAKEANGDDFVPSDECAYIRIVAFSNLVAAAEREACAALCESTSWTDDIEQWRDMTKRDVSARSMLECAAAIRARSHS